MRQLERDDPDWIRAVRIALGLPPDGDGASTGQVRALLDAESAGPHAIRLDIVVAAESDGRMVTAVVGAVSPGRSAMVIAPQRTASSALLQHALPAALRESCRIAFDGGLRLLEALVEPEARGLARAMDAAGFRFLTRLLYLNRAVTLPPPARRAAPDVEWLPYEDAHEPIFCAALEATYAQTSDCGELVGLRSSVDVLAGHRASGLHDPALWWVARCDGRPAGILLLAGLPDAPALEIVYLGVAQTMRGQGLGDALMDRAVRAARRLRATRLTLAVDRANAPARALYAKWGLGHRFSRDAWIASSPGNGG